MLIIFIVDALVLSLSIRTVVASGTIYIRADGSVDPPGSPISRNGNVYTLTSNINSDTDGIVVERDNVLIDGADYSLQGANVLDSRGITLMERSSIVIKRLRIAAFDYGIYLESCSDSQVHGNIIENNYYGIWLFSSIGNNITENNITACSSFGIGISSYSDNNEFTSNTIANSGFGIGVDYSSNYNTIVHNAFIDNTNQAYTQLPSTNNWDEGYPTGGNYWSDYNGTDSYSGPCQNVTGSDGIGDTPYVIDGSNQDNYPLMTPHTPHDLAVIHSAASRTVVGQGSSLNINATVANRGDYTETFNVTAYANDTAIQTETLTLTSGNSTTLTFTWNTSGFAYGNYTISAYAWPVMGETDTDDNRFIDDRVFISVVGDLGGGVPPQFFNCDGKVDGKDLSLFLQCFKGQGPP
jgi:parallel beta-helix repeat protein